jgi:hypothetical protein
MKHLAHWATLVLVAWGKSIDPSCHRAKRRG